MLNVAIPFRRGFCAHLALLQAVPVLRVTGDVGGDFHATASGRVTKHAEAGG